ncbi:hypothetical protein PCLA_15r0183 [Pseudomonas citronellolis]|nr:hypothetical protein PCLA_15r0183 [Pseudomonas citronellolis]
MDVSQPQRMRHAGGQRRSSRNCLHQFTKPDHNLIPCFNSFLLDSSVSEQHLAPAIPGVENAGISPRQGRPSQYCQARMLLQIFDKYLLQIVFYQ